MGWGGCIFLAVHSPSLSFRSSGTAEANCSRGELQRIWPHPQQTSPSEPLPVLQNQLQWLGQAAVGVTHAWGLGSMASMSAGGASDTCPEVPSTGPWARGLHLARIAVQWSAMPIPHTASAGHY